MIKEEIQAHKQAIELLETQEEKIISISEMIFEALKNDQTIFVAGNGGSASDSQHFAAEIIGRFQKERKAYPSVCLNTDTSILTAVGNDYGFDQIFSRQIEGLGRKGDIFIGISTSGNSKNIINAAELAKQQGLTTICFLGKDGGKLKELVDESIIIELNNTAHVQEAHITLIHLICKYVEEELCEESAN